MSPSAFFKEHASLVRMLRSAAAKLKHEADDQSAEAAKWHRALSPRRQAKRAQQRIPAKRSPAKRSPAKRAKRSPAKDTRRSLSRRLRGGDSSSSDTYEYAVMHPTPVGSPALRAEHMRKLGTRSPVYATRIGGAAARQIATSRPAPRSVSPVTFNSKTDDDAVAALNAAATRLDRLRTAGKPTSELPQRVALAPVRIRSPAMRKELTAGARRRARSAATRRK